MAARYYWALYCAGHLTEVHYRRWVAHAAAADHSMACGGTVTVARIPAHIDAPDLLGDVPTTWVAAGSATQETP